jgi:hypothetical protein
MCNPALMPIVGSATSDHHWQLITIALEHTHSHELLVSHRKMWMRENLCSANHLLLFWLVLSLRKKLKSETQIRDAQKGDRLRSEKMRHAHISED